MKTKEKIENYTKSINLIMQCAPSYLKLRHLQSVGEQIAKDKYLAEYAKKELQYMLKGYILSTTVFGKKAAA